MATKATIADKELQRYGFRVCQSRREVPVDTSPSHSSSSAVWDKFIDGLTGKLADSWAALLLTPAFGFWVVGLVAWIARHGWDDFQAKFLRFMELSQSSLIAVLIAGLIAIAFTANIVQQLVAPTLHLMDGYWPGWLAPISRQRSRTLTQSRERLKAELTQLRRQVRQEVSVFHPNEEVFNRLHAVNAELRKLPIGNLKPTKLGNIRLASNNRPIDKYGMNTQVCWPRLWILLPDNVKQEVTIARSNLDGAVLNFLWSVLLALWVTLDWWIPFISVISSIFFYRRILQSAIAYGDLVEAVFDTYRMLLYEALRLPLPKDGKSEIYMGYRINQYLLRGLEIMQFVGDDAEDKKNSTISSE